MPVTLVCPSCNRSLTAPDGSAGRVLGCPHCRRPVTVPATASVVSPANDFNFGPASRDEPTRPRHRREPQGGPSVAKMTVAIVLGLLLTGAIVAGGWYGYRLVFVTMPEMHRLEVEYSICFDKEKAAAAKLAAAPKYIPKPEPGNGDTVDLIQHMQEERERKRPWDEMELDVSYAQAGMGAIRIAFRERYGRLPRYLPPDSR